MKTLLYLTLFFCTSLAIGQHDEAHVDTMTQKFVENLVNNGVTQHLVAKRYCSGHVEVFKLDDTICSSKGTYFEVYVFWREEDSSYVKKIDNCGLYHRIKLKDHTILNYVAAHRAALAKDNVKHYKSETYTGTPELRTAVQPCFRNYQFTNGYDVFSKSYNLFDISNDSEGKNLNYEYNQQLNLVELDQLITELIETRTLRRQG